VIVFGDFPSAKRCMRWFYVPTCGSLGEAMPTLLPKKTFFKKKLSKREQRISERYLDDDAMTTTVNHASIKWLAMPVDFPA